MPRGPLVGSSGLGLGMRASASADVLASASQLVAAAVQVRRAMACARDVRPTRPSHLSRTVRHISMRRRRRAIYPRARRGAKNHLCSARRSSPSRGKGCAARLDDERTRSAQRRAAAADRWPQMPRKLARPHRGTPSKKGAGRAAAVRMPPSFRRTTSSARWAAMARDRKGQQLPSSAETSGWR